MKQFFFLILILFCGSFLVAQTGVWNPANADLSRPRTLMKAAEIAAVISYITSDSIYHDLYKRMYNEVLGFNIGPTTGNDGKRRIQACKAKNCAFILLLNRKPLSNGTLDTLTTSERNNLISRGLQMMNYMDNTVEAYPNWDPYLWRSNELVNQLIAYDLMLGAGIPDTTLAPVRAKLVDYAADLYHETNVNFFGAGFWPLKVNNHGLRTAGALALAAVVLNDQGDNSNADRRASSWGNAGMYNIEEIMWKGSEHMAEEGSVTNYCEGSHYLDFGFKHLLPLFQALSNFIPNGTLQFTYDGNSHSMPHPFYDSRYDSLYQWAQFCRMPDGRMPPLEDAFVDQGFPMVALTEKSQYLWEMDYSTLNSVSNRNLNEQLDYSSDDVRADFLAAHTMPGASGGGLFQVLPEAGSAVFRSDWGPQAVYLHLYAQHGQQRESAKGHNQADETSIMLHAFGQELAMDPGYLKWDRRGEVSEAKNHSMVLVDGGGPLNSSTLAGNGADAWLENPQDFQHFDYCEARTQYQSTNVVRKVLSVRGRYFFMADDLNTGSGSHRYDWRLHAHGWQGNDSTLGIFNLDQAGQAGWWWKKGVNLLAVADGLQGSISVAAQDNKHEYNYDSAKVHTTLQVTSQGQSAEKFLSILMPFVNDTPLVKRVINGNAIGMSAEMNGYHDLWVASQSQGATLPSSAGYLPSDLTTNAELAFFSVDSLNAFAAMYLQEATSLTYHANSTFSSTQSVDFILEKRDAKTYAGYINGPATVTLYFPYFSPGSVNGWGISSWNYSGNTLTIVFNQAVYFYINQDFITTSEEAAPSREEVLIYPNPAQNTFQLQLPPAFHKGQLVVRDLQGKTVRVQLLSQNQSEIQLNGIPAGTYLASVSAGGRTWVQKLVVLE
ncbi:MAG: T9SS type A sorting domain-containing protein [Bacteroidia bacterium]|nr:T9SS type A sorting domain-containing protein [Bacteroidia bacterium]